MKLIVKLCFASLPTLVSGLLFPDISWAFFFYEPQGSIWSVEQTDYPVTASYFPYLFSDMAGYCQGVSCYYEPQRHDLSAVDNQNFLANLLTEAEVVQPSLNILDFSLVDWTNGCVGRIHSHPQACTMIYPGLGAVLAMGNDDQLSIYHVSGSAFHNVGTLTRTNPRISNDLQNWIQCSKSLVPQHCLYDGVSYVTPRPPLPSVGLLTSQPQPSSQVDPGIETSLPSTPVKGSATAEAVPEPSSVLGLLLFGGIIAKLKRRAKA